MDKEGRGVWLKKTSLTYVEKRSVKKNKKKSPYLVKIEALMEMVLKRLIAYIFILLFHFREFFIAIQLCVEHY